ncbi:MAG: hypothetical protein LBH82_07235 [Bacteroidales bacterium]|jgi:hypothetical protein|nr:hypothetical protein [Bacteroidales bacterium]
MKKVLKIAGITAASLLALTVVVGAIVAWLVLTPERLTPIVRKQAEKFITCQTHVDKVELTLFKTFPRIGLQINNLVLVNPKDGATSDTLVAVDKCIAALNIRELINNNAIIVNEFHLLNGAANLFVDSAGNTNFDIFDADTTQTDTSSFRLGEINLDKISLENINASYTDLSLGMQAKVNHLDLTLKGKMNDNTVTVNRIKLQTETAAFELRDSLPVSLTANALNTSFKGTVADFDKVKGNLDLTLKDVSFDRGNSRYAASVQLALHTPLDVSIEKQQLTLDNTELMLNRFQLLLNGTAARNADNGDIAMDIDFRTNRWNIQEMINMIPSYMVEDITAAGDIVLSGKASGTYNDTLIPCLSADVLLEKASFAMRDIPFVFHDIYADMHAAMNMQATSDVQIRNLRAKTKNSSLRCSGTLKDVLNELLCDLNINAELYLPEFQSVFPADIQAKGLASTALQASFSLEQIQRLALEKMKVSGWVDVTDLDVLYNDSIAIVSPFAHVDIQLPSLSGNTSFEELLFAKIETKQLNADMTGLLSGKLHDVKLDVGVSNFMDTASMLSLACDFDFGKLNLTMDTLAVAIDRPTGKVSMYPSASDNTVPAFEYTYQSDHLSVDMGKELSMVSKDILLKGTAQYDANRKDILLQLDPRLQIDFRQGMLYLGSFPVPIEIPSIKSSFAPEQFTIRESRVILGKSDFKLSGIITNIDKYLQNTALLTGDLKFVSDNTDVDELMNLVNGLGVSDSVKVETDLENPTDDPFMVPMGVDITLHTLIKKADVGKTRIRDIEGKLTVEDGILVLEEMGFTSDVARMQLTAMYRSPRKNHLYAGIDFHLMDIDIAKLLDMIPDIDTIVPMLKSFAGKAEFHFAIETYLKSNYDLKMSTLRGAAALSGQNLILMDGEQFSQIAKMLRFKKKTQNIVDSISVELTVFRNEVELFPFMISMDKYKAILQGLYTINGAGKYNISITQTPFPIRLGLTITDPFYKKKKIKTKEMINNTMVSVKKDALVGKTKYELNLFPHFKPSYRITRKGVVGDKAMELKQLISQSLKKNVK